MTFLPRGARISTAILAVCLFALSGCTAVEEEPPPAASIDQPLVLTDEQAEALAAMPFKNFAEGITAFEGQLLGGDNGDMPLAGWIDFTRNAGYAKVSPPSGMPILIVWDEEEIAFLDLAGDDGAGGFPATVLPAGDWQIVPLDAEVSELTRMLAAMLLLSDDRPNNPLLLKQNGARYLGADTVGEESAQRYSGVVARRGGSEEFDLGTQYWLASDGTLLQFGFRASSSGMSIIRFDHEAERLEQLPHVADVAAASTGGASDGG